MFAKIVQMSGISKQKHRFVFLVEVGGMRTKD